MIRSKETCRERPGRLLLQPLLAALGIVCGCVNADAAITIIGSQYKPDQYFPEFNCYWNASAYPGPCRTPIIGATVHLYVKNTGASAVTVDDVSLTTASSSYSLKTVIKKSTQGSINPDEQNSIYFYWDDPPADLIAAGEPVWYRFDPPTIPAGQVGHVAVRLRYVPSIATLSFLVSTSGGGAVRSVSVDANAPQVAGIGFSDDRTKVYLHWRRNGGAAPTSVSLDGTDVTANTTTVGDPNVNFGASVISLASPLASFSQHVYQGTFGDGKIAAASQRAWTNKFIYATYSTFATDSSYTTANWVAEASDHGFNNVQMNLGSMGGYLGTGSGRADCVAHNYGYTILDKTKLNPLDPDMFFLNDEPDAEENNQSNTHCGTGLRIPCDSSHYIGTLVIKTLAYGENELRSLRPNVPFTVNLDGGLEPESFFTWGPAVDILQTDNYYDVRLKDSYLSYPNRIPLFKKATFSYAVARTACAGAEPSPSNHLLYANKDNDTGWPYPTPASKRFEAYYSLAGGSKGMGYWWLNPPEGLSRTGTASRALWREMGLVGNEIKTARPLIVKSTPVNLAVTPSTPNIWVRGVASGIDSLVLYVVNDNYFSDMSGCHYTNVPNASVTVTLPSWMQASPTAFEISATGLRDVDAQLAGGQMQVTLGTLELTRMIVITTNAQLRASLQQFYAEQVQSHVRNFAPELFVDNPPTITQHPANLGAPEGGTANFISFASGSSPLSYRWQKNQAALTNGGHYSGVTSAMLTISGVDSSDLASYRCVVTNSFGSATSNPALLSLATNGPTSFTLTAVPLLSGDTANEARAITPDGQWVVGVSGTRGFLHFVNSSSAVQPVSSDGTQAGTLTGVGYRTNAGQRQIVVSGIASSRLTLWMTADNAATWGAMAQGATGKLPTVPLANGLAGTPSDVFYAIWTDQGTGANDNWGLYLGRYSNTWPAQASWGIKSVPKPDTTQMNAVSSKGRAVGYRRSGSTLVYANYVADSLGVGASVWNFNGLDGTTAGQAFCLSADGTSIFGISPKGGATGTTNFAYKAVFDSTFPGTAAQLSIAQLPNFANTGGSSNLAIPYACTPDGRFAVGMSYRGTERAVLWDTRDPDPANWTVVDLNDVAATNNALGGFSRLTRAYGIGTNATGSLVIAGAGLDTGNPAKTRAFVLTLTLAAEPAITPPTVTISGSTFDGLTFTFPTFADTNVVYYLEYATNLNPPVVWHTITAALGTGNSASLLDEDPIDPRRFYRIRVQAAPPDVAMSGSTAGSLLFRFPSVAATNVVYCLDYTTNLTPPRAWTTITSAPGTSAKAGLSDPSPAGPQRFYRIRVR